ncbi:MAG: ABC transporter substrate-binding protein, partial [Dehalococcoidia bacterium]|nr:ABC transporter substrate-binding protein [Dehalococcoidia bacterium]
MKNKVGWLLSILLLVSIMVVSCNPAPATAPAPTTTTTPATTAPTTTPTTAPATKPAATPTPGPAPAKEAPTYGGVLTLVLANNITGFDATYTPPWLNYTQHLTNEDLLTGDWAKGPAGTGEVSWELATFPAKLDWVTGRLAESWELVDPQTIIFHIRKGVRFHNKPPVNGRELTADDVVFTWETYLNAKGFYYATSYGTPAKRPQATVQDKYTVVVKTPPGMTGDILERFGDNAPIIPQEVVKQYGSLSDWRNASGTGPFMLVDFVSDSSASHVKNPNYWMKDPVNPANTLPYVDGVKMLIISDISTRLTALRTGKVDMLAGVGWQDIDGLKRGIPGLKVKTTLSTVYMISMRPDTKPFDDIRVRRALNMAIDRPAMIQGLYGGNGVQVLGHIAPLPDYADMLVPLEQLPPSSRELFGYHPDTAKKLLAEAGFPNGFKTEVVCTQELVDGLTVVKDYLSKVGVDMFLDVRETGVWTSIMVANSHKQMFMQYGNPTFPQRLSELRFGSAMSTWAGKDPVIEQAYLDNYKEYFNPTK